MTVDEVMNRVQSGQSARDAKNAKLGTNSGDAAKGNNTEFQTIANSDFEERRQREIEIMKDIVYGKTPMNILKTTSERNDATEITFKTIDGKVDESKKIAPQRMTAESFIKTVMTIRNLSGQNVMIPESEIKKMGLELAPYAKPFYDEKNNKFYELSVTKRPLTENAKHIKLYKNNKVSQSAIDKLNAPSVNSKDGLAPDVKAALDICEKLSVITTGIKLEPTENANTFMPSTLGKISRKAKDTLSTITLNKWQSKKFVPQSGKLFLNTKGMNGTDILTNYLSSCAMRSFDTNLSTFLKVVESDRGFQSADANAKNAQLKDYKDNYELIKYKLHNICTELIASEMCKMLPDMAAEERLALSEGYLVSAMQRMNDLGKYLQDPYVMKFISKTVTDSVSRYNANFTFTTKQIVDANCKVCGYKNMFTVGNRDKAIFGEYEVPTNGDFKFSSFPTREATKEKPNSELDNANETVNPAAAKAEIINKLAEADNAAKALAGVVVEASNGKSASVMQENAPTNAPTNDSENVGRGVPFVTQDGRIVFNLEDEGSPLIFDSQGRVVVNNLDPKIVDPEGNTIDTIKLTTLAGIVNKNKEEKEKKVPATNKAIVKNAEAEKEMYIYNALSPEGKDVYDKFSKEFYSSSPSNVIIKYVKSKNYPTGTKIEVSDDYKLIVDDSRADGFNYEYYDNGWVEHLKEVNRIKKAQESAAFKEMNKDFTSTPVDVTPSPRTTGNEQLLDPKLADAMFSNVPRGPRERIIYPINEKKDKDYIDMQVKTTNVDGKEVVIADFLETNSQPTHSESARKNDLADYIKTRSKLVLGKDSSAAKQQEASKKQNEIDEKDLADSLKFMKESMDKETENFSKPALKQAGKVSPLMEEMPQNTEESKTDGKKKGKVKKTDKKFNAASSTPDPDWEVIRKTFGERTPESMQKSITNYVVGLTEKALSEKSLSDKKRAVEKENLDTLASKKVQAISSSQNAVTTLYNSVHNGTTAKQAKDVINKAERSSENAQVIEAATLKELDDIAAKEVDKVLKAYEENKDKHNDWGKCKTPASFMNYYYKNIVGAETKYGNDLKKQVKLTCRKMDAAVAADEVLSSKGVNYRMYDATTFLVRDEKSDVAELNAYTVHKIVEQQNAEPKIEKLTVYSGNTSLAENAKFDEQFRETFATVENMQANNGYIGKGINGMNKPVVYPKKVTDLRRAIMRDKSKND